MAGTHPENMKLFEGFEVGTVGSEDIIYGKRITDSEAD